MNKRRTPQRTAKQKQQSPPALRAALAFLGPMILLRFLSSLIAPGGWWWFLILGVVYLVNGYTAGRLYALSIYHARYRHADSQRVQHGAGAGILLFLFGWTGFAILVVLVNLFGSFLPTFQAGVLLIFGMFEFLAAMGLGAFGASRYH